MRNPNGYGCINNLGGKRRNPFRVRLTAGWEYDKESGKKKQIYKTLGYYPTRKAAMVALAEYNQNPYDLDAAKTTFSEIYHLWVKDGTKDLEASTLRAYAAAFKHTEPIHNMPINTIKKAHMQDIINGMENMSASSRANTKKIFSRVFSYAMENDIIEKDYSKFVKVGGASQSDIHEPYTSAEIRLLWDNINLPVDLKYSAKDIRPIFPVDIILMMIYTGVRPSELLLMECENVNLAERYMIGGIKNEQSKNRIIPIHDDIFPLVKARYDMGGKYLIPYKSDNPPTMNQYRRYMFDPVVNTLYLDHLPHDGRHTFSTFAERAGMDLLTKQRIMGHKNKIITQQVYTHKTAQELVYAVNQIKFTE